MSEQVLDLISRTAVKDYVASTILNLRVECNDTRASENEVLAFTISMKPFANSSWIENL